jgi:predicted unusual protein kinase regulating ubiquinone biosynthesis (AarF/ABC1/UbiB family)
MSRNRIGAAMPVTARARSAKLATLPIAYAGRRAAGVGKRALGRPREQVEQELQERTAEHLFEVLGELKGCVAKLGQLLAIFELGFGGAHREALARLQEAAPPMLPSAVHHVLRTHMGEDWRSNFRELDDRRAAAASLGQVHRGVWHDGRVVAVKVLYPGIRTAMESDLAQLRRISILAPALFPGADTQRIVDEMTARLRFELDYAHEAANQQAFAAAYADDPEFVVPQVVAQHGDVLITEWVQGTPLARIIASGTQKQRDRACMLIWRFNLSSPSRCGLVHADPHPGNFRLMPDGRLGVLDFGACAVVTDDQKTLLGEVCEVFLNGTPAHVEAMLRKHGVVPDDRPIDIDAIIDRILVGFDPIFAESFHFSAEWGRTQLEAIASPRLSNIHRQLTIPAHLTDAVHAAVTSTGVACQLRAQGTYRAEVARWIPGFADAIAQRTAREA